MPGGQGADVALRALPSSLRAMTFPGLWPRGPVQVRRVPRLGQADPLHGSAGLRGVDDLVTAHVDGDVSLRVEEDQVARLDGRHRDVRQRGPLLIRGPGYGDPGRGPRGLH